MSSPDERDSPIRGPKKPPRFGPNAVIREGPASEDAHVLDLFGSGPHPATEERRRSPRHAAVIHRAWLGWWVGPGEFRCVAACLQDISLGGARLATSDPPASHQFVWLCLGTPDPTECVQAKVLAVAQRPEGDFVVRLAFGTPCPHNLYQTAIYGLSAAPR
jgi:hypothetical protein